MREELEQELHELAPTFLKDMGGDPMETCMAFGCECEDGWFSILERLCTEVEKLNNNMAQAKFICQQIKSKFGELRVYWAIEPVENRTMYEDEYKQMTELVNKAEQEALNTCEFCGKTPARMDHRIVLCDDCSGRDIEEDTKIWKESKRWR